MSEQTYECCDCCASDPEFHAENPADSHDEPCTSCGPNYWRARAEKAEAEIQRLHEGTEPTPVEPGHSPTDAQFLHALLSMSPTERLHWIGQVRERADFGSRCDRRDHDGRLDRLQETLVEVGRERDTATRRLTHVEAEKNLMRDGIKSCLRLPEPETHGHEAIVHGCSKCDMWVGATEVVNRMRSMFGGMFAEPKPEFVKIEDACPAYVALEQDKRP